MVARGQAGSGGGGCSRGRSLLACVGVVVGCQVQQQAGGGPRQRASPCRSPARHGAGRRGDDGAQHPHLLSLGSQLKPAHARQPAHAGLCISGPITASRFLPPYRAPPRPPPPGCLPRFRVPQIYGQGTVAAAPNYLATCRTIWQQEGMRAFYSGIVPEYCKVGRSFKKRGEGEGQLGAVRRGVAHALGVAAGEGRGWVGGGCLDGGEGAQLAGRPANTV